MDLFEIFLEALTTIGVNKLRTGLAILGIVIGIGSVIALISLGQSTQASIQSQIQSLGSNLLTIRPGSSTSGAVRGATGGGTTLTNDDAKAIATSHQAITVLSVSPEYSTRAQVTTGDGNTNTQIIGVEEAYATAHNITIENGSFISQSDTESMSAVAVVGPKVATDLFGEGVDPIGQTIRVGSTTLTIIGTTVSKGGSGFINQDDIIYVPLSVAQKQLFGADYLTSIAVVASSTEAMTDAQNEIGYLLLERHGFNDPTEADFQISSQQDLLNTVSSTTGTFTTLLSGVAAISLVVGGIGIMNIMLVTVTERTREIGLRKALGAKKKTIVTQFLFESILLTCIGGVIGVCIGIIASYVISVMTNSAFILSPYAMVLASAVSACIGIIFGWYPAQRAAALQPIEALRYE